MDKKIKYSDLMIKISFLLKQYKDILKLSDSVMTDVKEYLANSAYDGAHRTELLDFLTVDEEGSQLVRLALLLNYVSNPQNKEVIATLSDNILNNNVDDIKSVEDVLELFNIPNMVSILMDLAVINIDDSLKSNMYKFRFENDDEEIYYDDVETKIMIDFEDDFDAEDDCEYISTPKKRILH